MTEAEARAAIAAVTRVLLETNDELVAAVTRVERVRALAERWRTEPAEDITARAALARELLAVLDQ